MPKPNNVMTISFFINKKKLSAEHRKKSFLKVGFGTCASVREFNKWDDDCNDYIPVDEWNDDFDEED